MQLFGGSRELHKKQMGSNHDFEGPPFKCLEFALNQPCVLLVSYVNLLTFVLQEICVSNHNEKQQRRQTIHKDLVCLQVNLYWNQLFFRAVVPNSRATWVTWYQQTEKNK